MAKEATIMSLFSLKGTVTSIGGGTLLPHGTLYDFIEITDERGRIYNVS